MDERDREPPSRRRLLRAGGAVAAGLMLGVDGVMAGDTGAGTEARHRETLDTEYFRGMYATEIDPWQFASSPYERAKYQATLQALPRPHYASALEVGCSIGVFSRQLCPRCDRLLGLDVVPKVLEAARERCADCPDARFEIAAVPGAWPEGRFDLVVISEVAYYLDRPDLGRLVRRVEGAVLPDADIVLCHWLGPTHYPLTGDEAAEGFIHDAAGFARVLTQSRTAEYRLDVLRVTRAAPPGK